MADIFEEFFVTQDEGESPALWGSLVGGGDRSTGQGRRLRCALRLERDRLSLRSRILGRCRSAG